MGRVNLLQFDCEKFCLFCVRVVHYRGMYPLGDVYWRWGFVKLTFADKQRSNVFSSFDFFRNVCIWFYTTLRFEVSSTVAGIVRTLRKICTRRENKHIYVCNRSMKAFTNSKNNSPHCQMRWKRTFLWNVVVSQVWVLWSCTSIIFYEWDHRCPNSYISYSWIE